MPPSVRSIRFLDANLLRSIAGIELKARLLVEGMYASRHRSPDYGYSVGFVDHRGYTRGEELRTIDWKMLARTERDYGKRFEMESHINVVGLVARTADGDRCGGGAMTCRLAPPRPGESTT